MGDAQNTAGTCAQAGAVAAQVQELVQLAVAAEPPTTPLQEALLPRVQPAPETSKPRGGFTQRNRATRALTGASYSGLMAQKADLERELVTLLNHHERLSKGLPWHMQHEEVSFMASIARCMAAGRPGALPESAQAVPNACQHLFQNLMLDPCAMMNNIYQAAGIGLAFPAGGGQPLQSEDLDAFPERAGGRSPVWSSIVTFLKLSKPQKDKLAAAYDAHVQRAVAVWKECLAIGTTLQAEGVLKLNLVTHLACGHLTSIAKEDKDLVRILHKQCYEVLDQVQVNNMLALAPAGSSVALGLCCEIAALRAAAATAEVGAPLTERHQNATRPVDASLPLPAGIVNAAGDMHGFADGTTDAATLVISSGGAARPPRNASAQAAHTKQVTGADFQLGTLDQVMATGAPPNRRRKRQTPESFSDSEGQPASKVQSTAAMLSSPTPRSLPPPPNPNTAK